jgi:protoheme IX farnesyltransferase
MVTTSNNHSTSTSSSFKNYVALTKPKLTALLLLTAIVEAFVVYSGNLNSLFLLIISVLLSCIGTNVLAGYLDRDIDSVMKRTMNRPLPKGKIKPKSAFIFGFSLLVNGIFIAAFINSYVLLWGLMGAGFVLLYNCWLKRYTPYNILIASPAGAAPLLGAYSAMTGNLISLQPFLLALLIIF